MGFIPKIPPKKRTFTMKQCSKCGERFGPNEYSHSNSIFFADEVFPMCNRCIKQFLNENEWNWDAVDKLCQMGDIPFIPEEWERIHEGNGEDTFPVYARVFAAQAYESIGWADYFKQFKELKEAGIIENELPALNDEKKRELKRKWDPSYSDEDLMYLEDLYNGIFATQNINNALQEEQAKQLCKISLEINSHIREGSDFDKLQSSYEKLYKLAGFSSKNTKSAADFDSLGEFFHWLEKRGWKNEYFDGVGRDVLDAMMQNFENFNQNLYVNESGISEEISRRIEQLKSVNEVENKNLNNNDDDFYDINKTYQLDDFDNEGYEQLVKDSDAEEFKTEV